MASPSITSRWRRRILRSAPLILGILGAALPACIGDMDPLEEAPTGEAAEAITCLTVQNVGPTTTLVDDAQIVTDPADPTRANTNYGALTLMNTGFSGSDYRRILIKFDLAGAGVPAGSTVTSATITMRMSQSLGKNPVDVHAATAPWSESAVTWNQMAAAPNGGLGALQSTIPTLGVPNVSAISASLDASLVTTWIDPALNYGLVLDHPLAGRTTLGASEAAPVSRPSLQVCYQAPTCADGVQNQGEAGVDCGGPCAATCGTCSDGIQNQGEAGADCGGPCAACATCSDGVQNQGETRPDCGGPCTNLCIQPRGIAASNYTSSIIRAGGTVWTTGAAYYGMLGNGTSGPFAPNTSTLVQAAGLTGVEHIASGYFHTLAVRSDGTLWAWGYNTSGCLGLGVSAVQAVSVPTQVAGLTGVVAASAGEDHSLALKNDGTVWAWGADSLSGGAPGGSAVPVQVSGVSNAVAVSAGRNFSLVLLADGTVRAWGANNLGQLGDGTTTSRATPVQVLIHPSLHVIDVSAGYSHSVAVVAYADIYNYPYPQENECSPLFPSCNHPSSTVWSWGDDSYGQLARHWSDFGPNLYIPYEQRQISPLYATRAVAGTYYTISNADGYTENGSLRTDALPIFAWGRNGSGQLGVGYASYTGVGPVQAWSGGGIGGYEFAAGAEHALVRTDGVSSWGSNWAGQLGDHTFIDAPNGATTMYDAP